jgi:hypothetical protein
MTPEHNHMSELGWGFHKSCLGVVFKKVLYFTKRNGFVQVFLF